MRIPSHATRLAVALASLIAALGTVRSATAAPPTITVENVRLGFDGKMKVGTWTPLWVDLKAGPAKFSGYLDAIVPDDDQTPTLTRRPVYLEAGGFATFVTYVRPGILNADLTVRVLDERMRNQTGNVAVEDKMKKMADDLSPSQTLIVTIGHPEGMNELPNLSGFSTQNSVKDLVVAPMASVGGLPSKWYGYDAATAIVLDTNDTQYLDALDTGKDRVLAEWVRNGGHLVITGTSNWQRLKEGGLKDLLPAIPTGTTRLNDLGALETFAGSAAHPITEPMIALTLEGLDERGGHALATTSSTPLIVRGPYGFGLVTLVGLDTDTKPFSIWEDKLLFWVKAIDLHGRGNDPKMQETNNTLAQQNVTDLATLLHRSLDDFPGVTLVPFGWVAFFVFVYILLIGPGDYFFLKKVVKRMELTWITFPLIVIAVSAAAYMAAYAVKGTDLRVNKVDLIDIDQTRNLVRGATWCTIFSPKNRDYDIGIAPLPLDVAYTPDSLKPAPKKRAGVETVVSAFGAADAPLGGGGGRLSLGGSGYSYAPNGEAEELLGVRIPIWSTKSVVGRWTAPEGTRLVETSLTPAGTDRIAGTITNVGKRPIKNAVLVFGRQIYDQLGDLAPGATISVNAASRTRPLSGYIGEANARVSPFANPYAAYQYQGDQQTHIPREDLLRVIMFRDALGNRSAGVPSVPFADLDLTGQLALDRPMLVGTLEGPAVLLDLEGSTSAPINTQTTLVRIILPLADATEAAE